MLFKKGAEGNLHLEPFKRVLQIPGDGKVMVKWRIPKQYRVEELDMRLRSSRTALEAKLLSDAKRAGVPTPAVYEINLIDSRIVMEFIKGKQVKIVLEGLKSVARVRLCRKIGRHVARLHRAGILHGDLTTSNMLLKTNGMVYFVDFGLGEYNPSVEGRGVDLHLLKRSFQSIHFRIAEQAYRAVLAGYRRELGEGAKETIKRANDIEKRGRYISKEERAWH